MFKKMLLLAGMALAAVAFMAPAIAQADAWYTDGVKVGVGTANHDLVTLHGALSSTVGGIRNGPCNVTSEVKVWNKEVKEEIEGEEVTTTVATGEVTSFDIAEPCQVFTAGGTPLPGCVIENATSEVSTSEPWHVSLQENTGLAIEGANFANHYGGGCAAFGIPTNGGASGTATGTFTNTGGCIVFNNSGDLKTPPPAEAPATINGSVCATGDLELGPTL